MKIGAGRGHDAEKVAFRISIYYQIQARNGLDILYQAGQDVGGAEGGRSHRDASGGAARCRQRSEERVHLSVSVQNLLGIGQKVLSSFRQGHFSPAADEEFRAIGALQVGDLLAHRRLGDAERTGGLREAPETGRGDEGPQFCVFILSHKKHLFTTAKVRKGFQSSKVFYYICVI